jgi:hypothetical protein
MNQRPMPFSMPRQVDLNNSLWWLTFLWGALLIWLSPHPPMIDMPAHVAQVSMLTSLLQGDSTWQSEVWINLKTPYLLGYGLSYLLGKVMPILTGMKILLTLAYAGFVWGGWKLRVRFGGAQMLDWLLPASFFGFCFQWGFFTFLLSAPLFMIFVMLMDSWRHPHAPRWHGFATLGVGLLLLCSHGLMFAFAWSMGAALLFCSQLQHKDWQNTWLKASPLIVLACCAVAYVLVVKATEQRLGNELAPSTTFALNPVVRGGKYLVFSIDHRNSAWAAISALLMVVGPWLSGLRPDLSLTRPGNVLFLALTVIFFTIPSFAMETAFLHERFALFFLPAYAWWFCQAKPHGLSALAQSKRVQVMAVASMALGTWLNFAVKTQRTLEFSQHTAAFHELTSGLKENQRAAYLALDRNPSKSGQAELLTHYGAYYQADHGGLVDFNFGWFPPQIIRYRQGRQPAIKPSFEWHPDLFNWKLHQGERYRYFIFHSFDDVLPARLMSGTPCDIKKVAQKGSWIVYEKLRCAP